MTIRLAILVCAGTLACGGATSAIASLIVNGSFELDPVTPPGDVGAPVLITGWDVSGGQVAVVDTASTGWQAADGQQWVDLGSGVEAPGLQAVVPLFVSGISQEVDTLIGEIYLLEFYFSPQPGVAENVLEVTWDGQIVDTIAGDGTGLSDNEWQYFSYALLTDRPRSRVGFADGSDSESKGGSVDDVSLTRVPEPGTLVLLTAGAVGLLRRRH